MPKELIAVAPRTPVLREYEEPSLNAGEVRLRTPASFLLPNTDRNFAATVPKRRIIPPLLSGNDGCMSEKEVPRNSQRDWVI